MNKTCSEIERTRGVLIYDGSTDDLKRLAGLLDQAAAAEGSLQQLTVTSPQAAEEMVRTLLAGLCQVYAAEPGECQSGLYRRVLRLVDASVVDAVLRKADGCQLRAAEILGINRNTLRSKMRELGISSSQQP